MSGHPPVYVITRAAVGGLAPVIDNSDEPVEATVERILSIGQ